jgi:hypothetical protein
MVSIDIEQASLFIYSPLFVGLCRMSYISMDMLRSWSIVGVSRKTSAIGDFFKCIHSDPNAVEYNQLLEHSAVE